MTYANETNPISKGYHDTDRTAYIDWSDSRLAKITRFRMLSDPGFPMWDISYVHGVMKDGTECRVAVPFDQLSKRRWKSEIISHARRCRVFAKGLGVFDAISTLN